MKYLDTENDVKTGSVSDLSGNKFAASMRELANGLAGWSVILLLLFYLWNIGVNEQAKFISFKTVGLMLAGELVFVLASKLANIVFAAALTSVLLPIVLKGSVRLTQNIQNSALALFGIGLCIAAWYFAVYSVRYAYS